jgi:hypothetical protein
MTIKTDYFITVIMLIATIFLLISYLSANNLEFSRYNPGWNGTSGFFDLPDRHTTEDIFNSSSLSGRESSILLIIAPRDQYQTEDLSHYRAFVQAGNTLFIADDFGTGNALLRGIGSSIVIIPGILASVDRAYNDSYALVTYPTISNPLTANVSSLVLDKAAALEGGEPLMKTTLMSWVDTDRDGRITKKEMLGKYTVLTHEKIGKGEVIVLSDPSIFINAMGTLDETWENKKFIENLIRTDKKILIDQTHSRTGATEGFSQIMKILKSNPLFTIIFTGLLILGLFIIIHRRII